MKKFKKNNFVVIKEALPLEIAEFLFHYFMLKREVAKKLKVKNLMDDQNGLCGTWEDRQVPNILAKHKDRFSCEVSTTLHLGGDPWPIFLKSKKKIHKVNLNKGDMLVYKGVLLEHWREPFEGKHHAQVFLHYNDAKKKKAIKFDGREMLGLPASFKV